VPESRDFWDECMAFSYEVTEKKKNIVYGTQAAHDDRIIAHALAYWVGRQKPFIGIDSALA